MCNFNNHLFVFAVYGLLILIEGQPLPNGSMLKQNTNDLNDLLALSLLAIGPKDDYNLHYDQRQKGSENYRLKLDGFFIGLPQEDDSALLLLTEELLDSLGNNEAKPDTELSSSSASLSSTNSKPEMVLVELPALPKHDQEARNRLVSSYGNADNPMRSKSYLYRLLNMLKHYP